MDISKNFGQRLKELRKSKKLTQSQFAELVGMEDMSISRIENGKRFPQKDNIEKFAKVLECEEKDLFDFRYNKTKNILKRDIEKKIKNATVADLKYYNKMIDIYIESRIKHS